MAGFNIVYWAMQQKNGDVPPERVAEWVRALDWRPGGPGFESRCGNF